MATEKSSSSDKGSFFKKDAKLASRKVEEEPRPSEKHKPADPKGLEGDHLLFDEDKEEKAAVEEWKELIPVKHKEHENEEFYGSHDEHKKPKKMIHHDDEGITIRLPKIHSFFIERLVYIIIIIVLAALLFKGFSFASFLHINDTVDDLNVPLPNATLNASTPVATATPVATPKNTTTKKEFWGVIDGECVPVDLTFEDNSYSTKSACLISLNQEDNTAASGDTDCEEGKVTVSIDDIDYDEGDSSRVINSIDITITNNNNTILNDFALDLLWYQTNDDPDVKMMHKLKDPAKGTAGYYAFSAQKIGPCGKKEMYTITQSMLNTKYFTNAKTDFKINVVTPTTHKVMASDISTLGVAE
jgi:hypothetical protein